MPPTFPNDEGAYFTHTAAVTALIVFAVGIIPRWEDTAASRTPAPAGLAAGHLYRLRDTGPARPTP
jgi:hypothetical protein